MTLQDLRAEIPALSASAYFNYGAHGPSPTFVLDAATEAMELQEREAGVTDPYEVGFEQLENARSEIARFLDVESTEIALTESTSDGINRFANALQLGPDDVVVRTDLEHPAGILPWHTMQQAGGTVRVVPSEAGRINRTAYAEAVEDATLVVLSAVTWTHGTRLPVGELVDVAHEAGASVLVDAVQVPGHCDISIADWGADAVAAAGHKWLLGPWGSGFLYVNQAVADTLTPGSVGYRSVGDPGADPPDFKAGAQRFEVAATAPAPHVGLAAAMGALDEIGIGPIEERIRIHTERLKEGISADRLLSPREYESGLVTIDVDEPAKKVSNLREQGIVVRSIEPLDAIRVSVHATNTRAEIDRLLEAL